MGNRLSVHTLVLFVVLAAVLAVPGTGPSRAQNPSQAGSAAAAKQTPGDRDATDVLGANAACLVCHLTFVKEPLARSHQLKGVSCAKCHGASVAHANDEHIGATRPDITYPRAKIDGACAACHDDHDVPAAKVIARFLERKLPPRQETVCTDCHGNHRIDKAGSSPAARG